MLDLSRNQVQNLTLETLGFHTGFHQLNLHSNKIHFIQPGLFKEMKDLRVLDLSRNHLNVFALSKTNIGPLTAVESLDLSSNGLYTGMSDYFLTESPSLVNLSLDSNSITRIGQNTFSGPSSLRKISLHNNVILEIEDGAFDTLDHLTELDLSKNSITCIIDFNLYNLAVLNLSKNSIEFFQSAKVKIINLSHNSLQSLTFGENSLQSLKKLFLQGNDLTVLDQHIFQRLPSIKYLQLQQNNLQICGSPQNQHELTPTDQNHHSPTGCVSFSSVYNLHFLYLSENNLRSLPAKAFVNTPLKLLDVSLNPGLDMHKDALFGLEHSLVHLLLRENNMSSLNTDLTFLKSLKHVDLSTNQLKTLPTWNKESAIESLNLQNNNLVTLDQSTILALERSLKTLYMGSNPLSCCDNLGFLHMVQHSTIVVPDIETVTCVHEEFPEPVNIEKVTREMCHLPDPPNYTAVVVVTLLVVIILLGLLVKCFRSRRRKHRRGFHA
ncbi:hypothetical protein GOODEAATRI_005123 [Goodea atripinnis]|uniref:Leucine rich repeat containing 32 n=1 Tax=Goodea atripinnis TaxID=208336 RepID=A0ABV0MF64_9TELE